MTYRNRDAASPMQARYLRPDAARYIRPDALRFVHPDVVRVLAPDTILAARLWVPDFKFRTDQLRIPAGQPGGGRWTDMLLSLIFGMSPLGDASEDSDGGEEDDGDGEAERTDAEEAFRDAYAGPWHVTSVDDGQVPSINNNPSEQEGERPALEIDLGAIKPDDINSSTDQTQAPPVVPVAQRSRSFTDKYGDPYYSPGGHHEMPQSIFNKWDLQPETRRVFNDGTTGSVPRDTFRTSPDGVPKGHFWDGPNGAHAQYNDAVREMAERFMNDRGISPNQMTPDQAWELLGEIRESRDSRIRDYNESVRLLRRLRLLRTGRGSE